MTMAEHSPIIEIDIGDKLWAATFSACGNYVLSGDDDGVRVWRLEDGREVARMVTTWIVRCLAVSKDGRWIAAGTSHGEVFVWDAETYEEVFSHWDYGDVNGVDFSPDSARLLVASGNRTATVWDVVAQKRVGRIFHHNDLVHTAKYSSHGDRIATATPDSVRVWSCNDGRLLVEIKVEVTPWYNTGLLWSDDQLFVLSNGKFRRIEASTGSLISECPVPECSWRIAMPPHGQFIAYSTEHTVTLWDTTRHTQLGLIQHVQDIRSISLSQDNRFLAVGGIDGKITINSLPSIADPIPLSRLQPTFQEPEIHVDEDTLHSWNLNEFANAEALLTQAVSESRHPAHHVYASRAIVRARLQYWDAAIIDAEKSIQIEPSVIGYIAKSVALVGKGMRHEAYRLCDIAFEHIHPIHISFLLLIKAIIVFTAGEHADAISRLDDLIATLPFNSTCYAVQAYMYLVIGNVCMERSDYQGAIQFLELAQSRMRCHRGRPFPVISMISGWRFDNLNITIRQCLCEALYSAGRRKDAAECLLKMVMALEQEVSTTRSITKWISDFTHQCLTAPESDNEAGWKAAGNYDSPTAYAAFNSPNLVRLLKEWAKATLTNGSWKDALATSVNFVASRTTIYGAICEHLEAIDYTLDAIECFHQMVDELTWETQANWVPDFKQRCVKKLVSMGDASVDAQCHSDAITYYSAVLSLNPAFPGDIFIKRSKACMVMGLWKDALDDTKQVTAYDPSSSWSYEKVLAEWVEVMSKSGSWEDALLSAVHFRAPRFMIYRSICERLQMIGCVLNAAECFRRMMNEFAGKTETDGHAMWILDFKVRCYDKLVHFGDVALDAQGHDEAMAYYSAAISLSPESPQGLLIKRSKARTAKGLWEDAIDDANKAVAIDSSSPWGYEAKHAALHAAGRYVDAVDTFETMLSKMAQSPDPSIYGCRGQYVSPSSTRAVIHKIVQRIIRRLPHVLVNTSSGHLCDKTEQASAFESLPVVSELISSMTRRIDHRRIKREVRRYFRYAMLSHKWEDNEPEFHQVRDLAVYDLAKSPTHDKLQMFCEIVRDAGFHWAWSDTCCIDRGDHPRHQEALVAMFQWYRGSAMMIVFLRGVHSLGESGDLARNKWNTRGWTLQEYVAAKVIRFYTEDWTPYLDLGLTNHKESPAIVSEMEQATGVSGQKLMALRPGLTNIREKLRLASTRQTTRVEDAAYSLFGIFSVTMSPRYGEREKALGRLLAHILAASGDTSILAWNGQSSTYNTSLPARINVYDRLATSYLPHPLEGSMEDTVAALRASSIDLELALKLYHRLNELNTPWFTANRLKLPCIAFPLPRLLPSGTRTKRAFCADTLAFGMLEIKTRQDLSRMNSLYLVHPWLDALFDRKDPQSSEFMQCDLGDSEPSTLGAENEDVSDEEIDDDSWTFPRSISLPDLTHSLPMDIETAALQLITRLRQPFGALLFTRALLNRRTFVYKRVAADSMITVRIQENMPLNNLLDCVCTMDVL